MQYQLYRLYSKDAAMTNLFQECKGAATCNVPSDRIHNNCYLDDLGTIMGYLYWLELYYVTKAEQNKVWIFFSLIKG